MKIDLNSFWSFMASLDWLKILPFVISLLTMFGGLYVYFRHDKAIKKLQKKQLQREEDENKKAKLSTNVRYLSSGVFFHNYQLEVRNEGKSSAHDIQIELSVFVNSVPFKIKDLIHYVEIESRPQDLTVSYYNLIKEICDNGAALEGDFKNSMCFPKIDKLIPEDVYLISFDLPHFGKPRSVSLDKIKFTISWKDKYRDENVVNHVHNIFFR